MIYWYFQAHPRYLVSINILCLITNCDLYHGGHRDYLEFDLNLGVLRDLCGEFKAQFMTA